MALRWELGTRASIPVGFAASAAFDKVLRAGKHGRAAAAVAEPGQKIHTKQSGRPVFLLFIVKFLWSDGCNELTQPSESLHKCFIAKNTKPEAFALILSWHSSQWFESHLWVLVRKTRGLEVTLQVIAERLKRQMLQHHGPNFQVFGREIPIPNWTKHCQSLHVKPNYA